MEEFYLKVTERALICNGYIVFAMAEMWIL